MQQLTGPGCLPPNLAGVQQLRTLPDSPSVQSPLAQRIREDIQISENEVDSPERESLRSQTFPEKSPHPSLPYVRGFPPPAPLVFTPSQIKAVEEVESVENLEVEKVVETTKDDEEVESVESVKVEKVVETTTAVVENVEVGKVVETTTAVVETTTAVKEIAEVDDVLQEDESDKTVEEKVTVEENETIEEKDSVVEKVTSEERLTLEERLMLEERIWLLQEALSWKKEKDKTPTCQNCGEVFAADHQCS